MNMQIELKNGYFQTNQLIEKNPIEKSFIEKTKKIVMTNVSFLPNTISSIKGYENKIGEKIINIQKKLIFILENNK